MASSMTFDKAAALRVEALYATPDVAATRVAAFHALDPRPGEQVADLGCGPGFMTRELALAVGPSGRVHGLDLSAPMLALARARCAGLPAVELAEADMAAMGLPNGSLDAAVALQSLEYVPGVACAVAEVARLLRPGGRAVVLDTDFGSVVWHGRDQARVDRILVAYDAHIAHQSLPRVLGRLATEVGLAVVRREVVPILNASLHPNTYAHGLALFIRDFVVGSGRVLAEEADGWLAECAALDAAGEFFHEPQPLPVCAAQAWLRRPPFGRRGGRQRGGRSCGRGPIGSPTGCCWSMTTTWPSSGTYGTARCPCGRWRSTAPKRVGPASPTTWSTW